jgi:hypothetical protein
MVFTTWYPDAPAKTKSANNKAAAIEKIAVAIKTVI